MSSSTQKPQSASTGGPHRHPSAPQLPQEAPASDPGLAIQGLMHRMRGGDRAAAAEFLDRYGARIRRRIRGKLNPGIRRLFDSLEILSTLGRRLDLYVMSGRLQVASEAQLWSLLFKMADHALVDKARIFRRLQTVETDDSEFALQLVNRLQRAEQEAESGVELEIELCLSMLSDATDRQILSLWLAGESHASIGQLVDLAPTGVRKRWEKIKAELRERLVTAE